MEDKDHIINRLGEDRHKYYNAVSPPIIQSSNFAASSVEDMRKMFSDEAGSHLYTRGNNPTVEILRKKVAALEHTEDALIFSSGSAAIANAVISQVSQGDHIVCVKNPYSWTIKLLENFLSRFGVTHTYVDGTNLEEMRAAFQENTKVLFLESPNTFYFGIQDLSSCAAIAKEFGAVSMIDNSYCSPIFQNPADHGVDIVIHSGTKYINGHSDVVVGIVCASNKIISQIFHGEYMTLGAIISPSDAALVIRGLRTLALRMQRINDTSIEVFEAIKNHKAIRQIFFPFDPSFPQYEIAKKQMTGTGGLFTIIFETEDKEALEKMIQKLNLFLIAVSWGGHESLMFPSICLHDIPGKETPPFDWRVIRFSIGLESPKILINNLLAAFDVL